MQALCKRPIHHVFQPPEVASCIIISTEENIVKVPLFPKRMLLKCHLFLLVKYLAAFWCIFFLDSI